MKHKGLKTATLLLFALLATAGTNAVAQTYQVGADGGVAGDEMFRACAFCHGSQGQGRQRLDAPPIAGLQAWYIERQMHNFENDIRGAHPDDLPGAQMVVIKPMFRNEATIRNVAAHIETLAPGAPPMMRGQGPNAQPEPTERPFQWESKYASLEVPLAGDVANGQRIYQASCVICHGADAVGNQTLGTPNLTVLADWYMARQMQYFRDGIRGADPRDIYGAQMAVFAKLLANDQAIADVVTYIDSL